MLFWSHAGPCVLLDTRGPYTGIVIVTMGMDVVVSTTTCSI